jgi:hypothetical protein
MSNRVLAMEMIDREEKKEKKEEEKKKKKVGSGMS